MKCRGMCDQGRRLCVSPDLCELFKQHDEEDTAPLAWKAFTVIAVVAILACIGAAIIP